MYKLDHLATACRILQIGISQTGPNLKEEEQEEEFKLLWCSMYNTI